MNPKNLLMALCLILALSLSGCGGRTANPTDVIRSGDKELDCEELEFEIGQLDTEMRRKLGENARKTGKNIAIGIGGLLLWPAWFFLDLSDAERLEAEALQDRLRRLQRMHDKQDCDE